jgi:hypothetical protein
MPSNMQKVFGNKNTAKSGASTFVMPGSVSMGSRDFKGASTPKKKKEDEPPFGPPMNGANWPGNFGEGGFTHEGEGSSGSVGGGGGGGGIGTAGVMASMDKKTKFMESRNQVFTSFLEALRTKENDFLIEIVFDGFMSMLEAKNAKDIWAKKASKNLDTGSLKKALDVPEDKDIVDSKLSAETIAKKATKAFGHDKAMKKLNFAANIDKTNNVLDTARNKLAKMKK